MAIDKSKWNLNVKVSQKTIDEIKKMGMTKALKTASGSSAAARANSDASAKEWNEGLRRLYGADKVDRMSNMAGGAKSAKTVTYKGPSKPKGAYTKGSTKSQPKKNNFVETGKKVALGAAAIGTLAATRGRGAAIAARLAPGVAKSGLGKALIGSETRVLPKVAESVKVGPKGSFGKTTSAMAKGGKKIGTKSEFATKATQESARKSLATRAATVKSEGVTVGPKGSFGKTTSTAAKKSVAKKAAPKIVAKTTTSKPASTSRIVKGGFYKGMIATTTKTKNGTITKYTKPKGGKK